MSTLDHVGVTVADFDKAFAWYESALAPLGVKSVMKVTKEMTGGQYEGAGFGKEQKPDFWIGAAPGKPASSSVHICLAAENRAAVDAFYAAAIAAGGKDNGPPGIRAQYHPNYYGAFVFDLDGHNVEACVHTPE